MADLTTLPGRIDKISDKLREAARVGPDETLRILRESAVEVSLLGDELEAEMPLSDEITPVLSLPVTCL